MRTAAAAAGVEEKSLEEVVAMTVLGLVRRAVCRALLASTELPAYTAAGRRQAAYQANAC
jgi:hypothetical protein